jgi:viroplasmin and RNaseH domain-containing protein
VKFSIIFLNKIFNILKKNPDINAAYEFISKMPLIRGSSAATQTMIKEMHNLCMESVTDNKDKENLQSFKEILQTASKSLFLNNRFFLNWEPYNCLYNNL